MVTNCGPYNADNPGAYGNEAVTDDIPAVEVNVVGGTVTGLYPGAPAQPLEYAITNPGTGPVQVHTVSSSVDNNGTDVEDPGLTAVTGCHSAWYQINGSAQTLDQSVPPGTTLFTTNSATATVLSIQMLNVNTSQDSCEGADIGLSFSSN